MDSKNSSDYVIHVTEFGFIDKNQYPGVELKSTEVKF
jgi:hypothetical protein